MAFTANLGVKLLIHIRG